ncbi:2Fe-2S iron-sulfur cluster-binding protein [Bacillus sp. FJAT-28004]|uniref:2Fe-2S iron-sulfur cluster-binding protein n=1 Tax=Bacillus sp. FJAT-28004 TaxID=1679165 RepID=UPI0006B6701B|nr:2Fe-2S iron-sulfur cluster-binding protein [Bacillus sp. FJAT-28004]
MNEFNVKIQPSNQTFTVGREELILDAAIRQGVRLPYSCRNGTCRTCLIEVKEGTVQPVDADLCMISVQELELNRRLLCMSLCQSDAVVERVQPRRSRTSAESAQ